jgi:hypothetical protein
MLDIVMHYSYVWRSSPWQFYYGPNMYILYNKIKPVRRRGGGRRGGGRRGGDRCRGGRRGFRPPSF